MDPHPKQPEDDTTDGPAPFLSPPSPPSADDPRLAIPEALRHSFRKPADQTPAKSGMAETAQAWGIAMEFVALVIGCGLAGYFFDNWRGTTPIGVLVGLGLGFVFALYKIIRTTQKQEAREKAERAKRG